jgi:hypothetical protein
VIQLGVIALGKPLVGLIAMCIAAIYPFLL